MPAFSPKATIFSTTRNVTNLEKVTIGRPIANTQIYILNKNKKLMPQGTVGEIYIAGDGVGKGYMNKKEQTEKLVNEYPIFFRIRNTFQFKKIRNGEAKDNRMVPSSSIVMILK